MRNSAEDAEELQQLIGELSNVVNFAKETLVMGKMNEMMNLAVDELDSQKSQIETKVN